MTMIKYAHSPPNQQVLRGPCHSQVVFAVLLTGLGRSLIYQVLPALFFELHRLRHTIKNFVVTVVSRLEYIHVQQVESLRKLGIQGFKPFV